MPRGSRADAVGHVTRLTVTPATTTTVLLDIAYAYNDLSQMVSLTSDGKTTTYAYEAGSCASCGGGGGNLTTITRPNGIVTNMTYDRASQVRGIRHAKGTGPALSYFFYTYDSARNRATMRDITGMWTYTYDKINRLKDASATIWPELGYEYDAGGNRTGATNPMSFAAPEAYTYNADDELTDMIGGGDAATTVHFEWDSRGNLARRDVLAGAGSGLACTFDGWERLTKAVSPSATKYFGYDSSGERVEEVTGEGSGAARRWFVYEGLNVVMELNGAGWPTALLVPGLSKTRLDLPEPFTEYFLHDALGSVAELTDSQGNLTQEYWYEPFGNAEYAPRRDPHNRYRFVGLQQDDDLGLIYMNARWYDPAIGRFVSRDPVCGSASDSISLNRYPYVLNNPVKLTDPTGRSVWDWWDEFWEWAGEKVEKFVKKRHEHQAKYPKDNLGCFPACASVQCCEKTAADVKKDHPGSDYWAGLADTAYKCCEERTGMQKPGTGWDPYRNRRVNPESTPVPPEEGTGSGGGGTFGGGGFPQ